jgi:flagellar basal body rod protein FlgG
VIDPASSDTLREIARRFDDVVHAYDPAFRPQDADVIRRDGPAVVRDASPLSVAPPRGAYFLVRRDGQDALTQAGSFRFVGGELQTRDGADVLGFSGSGRTPHALRADPIDVALQRVTDAQIGADGSVTCRLSSLDPVTGRTRTRRVTLGRIALAALPAGTQPPHAAGALVRPAPGTRVRVGIPGAAGFGVLATHVRELGAVDLEASLDRLREAYARFEALQAAHRSSADVEKTTMDLLK